MTTNCKTVEELALEYQGGNVGAFELIMMDGKIKGILDKLSCQPVWGHTWEDLRQELSIELERTVREFKGDGGASLSTLFYSYSKRRIFALRQSASYTKRRANYLSSSYETRLEETGEDVMVDESASLGFGLIETSDLLEKVDLTEKEMKMCKMYMYDAFTKAEIAEELGVTITCVNYYIGRVRGKLQKVI